MKIYPPPRQKIPILPQNDQTKLKISPCDDKIGIQHVKNRPQVDSHPLQLILIIPQLGELPLCRNPRLQSGDVA